MVSTHDLPKDEGVCDVLGAVQEAQDSPVDEPRLEFLLLAQGQCLIGSKRRIHMAACMAIEKED